VRAAHTRATDRHTRASRAFNTVDKWAGVRMDGVGSVFILGLGAYLVYGGERAGASAVGFALDMAFGFARLILWLVVNVNETQSACARGGVPTNRADGRGPQSTRTASSACRTTSARRKSRPRRRGASRRRTGPRAATCVSSALRRGTLRSVSSLGSGPALVLNAAQDGPAVLEDISFHVKSGERVGIGETVLVCVGRSCSDRVDRSWPYGKRQE
jgi:ABC-type multidrug transport system fused ATPase/permease subunit